LKSAEHEYGLTLSAMVQAAWALVLARHSGQDDIVFGATVPGRPADLPGIETTLGLFVNTLPIRVQVHGDQPLLDWMKEVQGQLEETRRYDYLPLEQIKSWSEVPAGQRLLESLVASEPDPIGRSDSPWRRGVKVDPLRRSARHGGYPLVGMVGSNGRTFRVAYSPDSIDAGTARVMLRGMRSALAGLITSPEQKVKRLLRPQRGRRSARTSSEESAVDQLLGLCLAIFQNQEGEATRSPLVPLETRGSKLPLFCFHPAGATTRCYKALARYLGADQPVYGVQPLPERGADEQAPSLEEMVDHSINSIRSVQPAGPYLLAGWSVGGAAAFVTAQRLLERGERVGLLGLMEASVPDKEAAKRGLEGAVAGYVRQLGLDISMDFYLRLSPERQTRFLLDVARGTGLFAADVTVDQFLPHARAFKAYFHALRGHTLQRYPGRVVLFRTGEAIAKDTKDAKLGWGAFAAEVDLKEVPGTHSNMIRAPQVRYLAEKLKASLPTS
jgi:thioesterase domain-containing protein